MKIEIDDDSVDMVIQESLVQTYKNLTADLKIHKKTQNYLHEEDAVIYQQVADAIKVLGNWYFVHGEFDKRVNKK